MAALSGMTGFARLDGTQGDWRWAWEVRSVNGKGLEARFRLPAGFDRLDIKARELAKQHFNRGNLQASLTLKREGSASAVTIDQDKLAALLKASQPYIEAGSVSRPSFGDLLQIPGVLGSEEITAPDAALDRALLDGLDATLAALKAARLEEGAALAPVLSGHVNEIERLTVAAGECSAVRIDSIRDRFRAKFAELIQGDLPEERLAQEAAAMAVKMDIREELDRLNAHIGSARDLLSGGSPVGRKLDFLCQEFNREANTLCSKSSDSSLTQIGLDLKNTIDQFREQVQNVE
ncbi:YicC/YloC family endoribonuclease [Maricaulis parjimensis]|uniref:YicC/YloC family endoribonuclease n=1 Tax=Maricaulis parjimensis TaxID=144023 RepID=UPI001939C1CD|nr:YicC/YloC family endoribonuclease [Maricaulis parjimensis]